MVARVQTVAFQGIDVVAVDVQVTIASGLPAFNVVGLPDKAVAESRERVRAALHALGLALPPKRITVNLAPADLAKEGSHFDLPIALGLLVAMEILPPDEVEGYVALGELGARRLADRGRRRAAGGDGGGGARPGADLPGAVRRRGGLGRRARGAGAAPTSWRWSIISRASRSCRRPSRASPRSPAQRARPHGHQGPGDGQARARGRGGRRPPPADDRPARLRQVDAGGAAARPPAAARSRPRRSRSA